MTPEQASAVPRRSRHRVPVRADISPGDAARGPGAQGPGRANGIQPARAADQPGAAHTAGRRRATSRADRAHRPDPAAARRRTRMGGARRRRARRAFDHGPHEGLGSHGTAPCTPSTCTRRITACPRPRPGRSPEATPRPTPPSSNGVLAGQPGPARDVVLLNAGAALLVAGVEDTVQGWYRSRGQAIDSGAARSTLDRLVLASRGQGSAA